MRPTTGLSAVSSATEDVMSEDVEECRAQRGGGGCGAIAGAPAGSKLILGKKAASGWQQRKCDCKNIVW